MKKKTLLIMVLLAWACLMGCAVTLKNYKPANPEEAAIIAVIIAFEESFNKADQKLFLSIMADDARIMHGREKRIFNKEEYARILPERMKEIGIISFSNPKIKIDREMATVQATYQSKMITMPYSFELKKYGDKWLILRNVF